MSKPLRQNNLTVITDFQHKGPQQNTQNCTGDFGAAPQPNALLKRLLPPLIGLILIAWLVVIIGPMAIVEAITHASLPLLGVMITTQALGLYLRSCKYQIYLRDEDRQTQLEVFTYSRLGGEFSTILFFGPLARRSHRSAHTAAVLLVDRLLEIGMTLVAALIAMAFIGFVHPIMPWLLFVILAQLGLVILVVTQPFAFPDHAKNRMVDKFLRLLTTIRQNRLRAGWRGLGLIGIIALATLLDFCNVYLGFRAVSQVVDPLYIPIVWTAASTIGILALINLGPGETTWIFLFDWLHQVAKAKTLGMIVLTRSVNVVVLSGLFAIHLRSQAKRAPKSTAAIPISRCVKTT